MKNLQTAVRKIIALEIDVAHTRFASVYGVLTNANANFLTSENIAERRTHAL